MVLHKFAIHLDSAESAEAESAEPWTTDWVPQVTGADSCRIDARKIVAFSIILAPGATATINGKDYAGPISLSASGGLIGDETTIAATAGEFDVVLEAEEGFWNGDFLTT